VTPSIRATGAAMASLDPSPAAIWVAGGSARTSGAAVGPAGWDTRDVVYLPPTPEREAVKRILAYLAVALVIAGCSFGEELQNPGDPVDMTPSSLAGIWHGGTQRFITFDENGTFTAVDLPAPPFQDYLNSIHFDPAHSRLDGSGTWTLLGTPNGGSPAPRSTVHLRFDHLAGQSTFFDGPDLSALRPDDGKVHLVTFYTGDQDNGTTSYLKCAGDCVVPGPASPSPTVGATPRPS
jgi:hypothetical protein